jgi:hypothetical protein
MKQPMEIILCQALLKICKYWKIATKNWEVHLFKANIIKIIKIGVMIAILKDTSI